MNLRRGGFRAAAAVVVVAGGVAYVGAAGASEPRAEVIVKALQSNTWDKPTVAIQTGDTVTWDLDSGNFIPHNVEGLEGPEENWRKTLSPPRTTPPVSYTFNQPGTYTYLCRVHPEPMQGTVTVTGAPATPTATPSETPTETAEPTATPRPTTTATPVPTARPGDTITTPAPSGSAVLDRTAPALTKFSLKAVRLGATVRFTLSEPAAVTIRAKHGKTTVRTVRLSARAGNRAVTIRGSKLARGSYRFEIEARDARGNRAPVQRKNVKVTR
jgi:plastocyanin